MVARLGKNNGEAAPGATPTLRNGTAPRKVAGGASIRRKMGQFLAVALLVIVHGSAISHALAAAPTAPFMKANAGWDGLSRFTDLAEADPHVRRVVNDGTLPLNLLHPEDAIVLVHPTTTLDVDSLTEFLRAGGRVLVFDDYGTADGLLDHFGIERRPAPSHPLETVRGNENLPVAHGAAPDAKGAHPTVAQVPFVVLNHPTALRHPNLTTVLEIAVRSGNDNVVGVAGAVGKGRLLVVSDASVFINDMLRFSGNRAFASSVIRYAVEDDSWGERGGNLYIATGNFQTLGSFGGKSALAEAMTRLAAAAKDEARSAAHEGLSGNVAWALAIPLALLLLGWLRSRAGTLHRALPLRWARGNSALAEGGLGAHVALLTSPVPSRALHAFEWKNAVEETVSAVLHELPLPRQQEWLWRLVDEEWLPKEMASRLTDALASVATMETAQLSRGAVREPSAKEIAHVVSVFRETLARLHSARSSPGGLGGSLPPAPLLQATPARSEHKSPAQKDVKG